MDAVRAALAEEELRKTQAYERRAAELGEERWVLDVPASVSSPRKGAAAVQIELVSMADIDALSDTEDENDGRRKFGPNVSISRKHYGTLLIMPLGKEGKPEFR
jgi:hypothetical protein